MQRRAAAIRVSYGRQVVLHASGRRTKEAAALLLRVNLQAKVHVVNSRESVLTTSKGRAAEARELLRRWATRGELVPEELSAYYVCGSCRRVVGPVANYCRHCGSFVGDAHAM